MHKTPILLLGLLLITFISLFVVVQIPPPAINVAVGSPTAYRLFNGFHQYEYNTHDAYRWSGERSWLVLDGYWHMPIIMDMRLTTNRPPHAPPATTRLSSGTYHSPSFVVTNGWRHYRMLLPTIDFSQHVAIDVALWSAPHEKRTLGVALNNIHIMVPTQWSWRVPPIVVLVILMPLPLLFFLASRTLLHRAAANQQLISLMRLPVWLTWVIAIAIIFPICHILRYPIVNNYSAITIYLYSGLALLVGILILPYITPYLVAPLPQLWTRTDTIAAGLFALGTIVVRLSLLPGTVWQLHADDYAVGVAALDILDGHYPLYYDEAGTLSAYLIAPFFAYAGVSLHTLLLLPIGYSAILTIAIYGIAHRFAGRWGAIAAASWMTLPSATAMYWGMKPQPVIDALTLATLCLWATLQLMYATPSRRMQHVLMAVMALTVAATLWINLTFISLLLVCVGVVAMRWQRLPTLPLSGYALFVLIVGGILYPLHYTVQKYNDYDRVVMLLNAETPQRIHTMFTALLPQFVGITRPLGREPIPTYVGYVMASVLLCGVLVVCYRALYHRQQGAIVVLVLAIGTFSASIFTQFFLSDHVRYIMPALIVVPLGIALLIASIQQLHHRYGAYLSLLIVTTLIMTNVVSSYGDAARRTCCVRPEQAIADALMQHNVRYLHTTYLLSTGIMFESGKNIMVGTDVGPARVSFNPTLEATLRTHTGSDTAFVFSQHNGAITPFEDYLANNSITCQKMHVLHQFTVYLSCEPFPDISHLQKLLPENLLPEPTCICVQ